MLLLLRPRQASLDGVNLLGLAPRRVASWSEEGGLVVLRVQAPACPWRTPFEWLSYKMSAKSVRLDEVGSFAWKLLDGRRTVAQVAERLRVQFGDQVDPAEERLGEMIRMLRDGRMLVYASWDPNPAAADYTSDVSR